VKVIFNKNNFYSNSSPNALGCAGDVRNYFDPQSDRLVPVGPTWLRNVSVDITNSNALNGPSQALACGLTGNGAPASANCASFDDLQLNSGALSRSIFIGGYGCLSGTAACAQNAVGGDIWSMGMSDVSTAVSWSQQAGGIPVTTSGATASGLVWASGGYDVLHDQFYLFGGAGASGNTNTAALTFSNKVVRVNFNADGTVATSPAPDIATQPTTSTKLYAGWTKSGAFYTDVAANSQVPPPALVGATFTYGLRRDPSMKSYCAEFDSLDGPSQDSASQKFSCTSSTVSSVTGNTNALAISEHEDYYLLNGGMLNGGLFSTAWYSYKPHSFSNDTSGGSFPNGDWTVLNNITTSANLSSSIMSVMSINAGSSSSQPYVAAPTSWFGRAYHRTVYDPTMNRFYIFGGLLNHGALTGAPVAATTTAPDVATGDVWIYDPPALGRRPTSTCYTTQAPDGITLPSTTTITAIPTNIFYSSVLGTTTNLGVNRNYTAARAVFPPGGCLQHISLPTAPTARFEHSMAFDRDQGAVLLFGGCTQPAVIADSGNTNAGDPRTLCTSVSTLRSDTWLYVPPVTTEITPLAKYSTTSPLSLISNIFNTDFWLDHLSVDLTAPTSDQVLGTWIQLAPNGSVSPSPRVSAAMSYDRAHKKFYLQGGFGCVTSACSSAPQTLNDLWEFTPPNLTSDCSRTTGSCGSNQGTWKLVRANIDNANGGQPPLRMGGVMDFAQPGFSYSDDFYTVLDSSCTDQGPIASTDASVNKQYVGAIYVDIDRNSLTSSDNLLINLKFLPFDTNTRLPAYSDMGTPGIASDDTDASSPNDTAIFRVQLLSNPLHTLDQIQSTVQPRFHQFLANTPVLANEFVYVSGPSGQVTEKQIHIPLASLDSSVDLIKIERIQGSVKIYEMTVSKF
jgi:hypothetical protein